jgi:hypothetical protein
MQVLRVEEIILMSQPQAQSSRLAVSSRPSCSVL